MAVLSLKIHDFLQMRFDYRAIDRIRSTWSFAT
jgi:hypothetical protein